MSGSYHLKAMAIEGFRGINQILSLNLDRVAIVLFGRNGTGKTSILQAIEWGLFGNLPYLSGPEFGKEDAIVNDFHPGQVATVKLTLVTETGATMELTRTRRKASKTTFTTKGASSLMVQLDDVLYEDKAAQSTIFSTLGLNLEEFYAAVHLHQEAIRAFIVGDVVERSKTVDKLLGLYHLRDMIEGLGVSLVGKEVKRLEVKAIGQEAKAMEVEIKELEESKISASIFSRTRLAEQEQELLASGISAEELKVEAILKSLERLKEQLLDVASQVGAKLPSLLPLGDSLDTASSAQTQLKQVFQGVRNQHLATFRGLQELKSRLSELRIPYEGALRELAKVQEGGDVSALLERRQIKNKEKNQVGARLSKLADTRDTLQSAIGSENNLTREIGLVQSKIDEIEKSLGDENWLKAAVQEVEQQMAKTELLGQMHKKYDQLLAISIEYLEASQPEVCPVCKRPFAPALQFGSVVENLQKEAAEAKGTKVLDDLRKEHTRLKGMKQRYEGALDSLKAQKDTLSKLLGQKEALRKQLASKLSMAPTEPLAEFLGNQLESTLRQIRSVEQETRDLQTELDRIDQQVSAFRSKQKEVAQIENEIVRFLKLPGKVDNLFGVLQAAIQEKEDAIDGLESVSAVFPQIETDMAQAERILTFLRDKNAVAKLEEEAPMISARVQALQGTLSKLRELETGLVDIYVAATEHQRAIVEGSLVTLHPMINSYYSKILGHPEYMELQLLPEEEKKGVYKYWLTAYTSDRVHSAYIPTKFSTAQMNAAAIAIFLSMSAKLPHNLGLLIMDDPTNLWIQSTRRPWLAS